MSPVAVAVWLIFAALAFLLAAALLAVVAGVRVGLQRPYTGRDAGLSVLEGAGRCD